MIWPFNHKPKAPIARGTHPFDAYSVGQSVTYAGRPAVVTYIDPFRDDESFVEELELYYYDDRGAVHREALSPREVSALVTGR